MKTFIICFLFASLSLAEEVVNYTIQNQSPGLRSSFALKLELKSDHQIFASLQKGFHFNEKAPNGLRVQQEIVKPSSLKPMELSFENLNQNLDQAKLSLYVCDDAVTYCETHQFTISSVKKKTEIKKESSLEKSNSVKSSGEKSAPNHQSLKINKHGFIEQNFQKAIDLAKSKGKLLLVDFGARWCPGCVRLETEIFDQKFFKSATEKFVKVKIDTDLFENVVLTEKFKIYGIPTLMVMNADQKEISRVVDYQPENILTIFFEDIKSYPEPIEILKTTAHIDSGQKLLLGRRLVNSAMYSAAVDVLKTIQPLPPELHYAQIESARQNFEKDPTTSSVFEKTLTDILAVESKSSRSIAWRKDLVELLKDEKKKEKIADEGILLANQLIADPELLKSALIGDLVGEFTGYEAFWIAIMKAELVEAAKGELEGRKSWVEAANVAEKLNINPKLKGPGLRYLLIITLSKDYEKADLFSKEMLKLDPQNWDVARRRLKILVELKKFDEAISLGEKVIKNSYDRNQFWVAETLAKAYVLSSKNEKAKALLEEFLAKPEATWAHMAASKKKLEDLRAQLDLASGSKQ